MISSAAAKAIIKEQCEALPPIVLPIKQALGTVLAEDIYAPVDIPCYPQSSMDGYAFSYTGWKPGEPLDLYGEMAAGSNQTIEVIPGKAVRIFTGAAVPPGADTVVIQEKIRLEGDELHIEDPELKAGDNVRPIGSEISKNALALEKGTLLTAPGIGFLAGIGLAEVKVYPKPRVAIIVTGNELQEPGKPLEYGQVYESNSASLTAALEALLIRDIQLYRVADNLNALSATLATALEQSDLVLLTGGISVGDYDFTLKATLECGIETIFHKIKQKPGKPILFGKQGQKPVFGLPGNPASVMTCFYEYVLVAIGELQHRNQTLRKRNAILANTVKKPAGPTHYLKGYADGEKVMSLEGQESYKLNSFARANCLIMLPEECTQAGPGDAVEIHILPF